MLLNSNSLLAQRFGMSRYVNVDGHMTLTGNVDWYYQRDAAEEDAAMIQGVKGISANLSRTPHHPKGGGGWVV
jgi:osmotically-inducible protein OsmY